MNGIAQRVDFSRGLSHLARGTSALLCVLARHSFAWARHVLVIRLLTDTRLNHFHVLAVWNDSAMNICEDVCFLFFWVDS